jgi:hypothetical protein
VSNAGLHRVREPGVRVIWRDVDHEGVECRGPVAANL